jgi:hypothetical protein
MADNFFKNHGGLGKGFRFISGGQKTQWYHGTYLKYLQPALYNLAKHMKSADLKEYLSRNVGVGTFSSIEKSLIPILEAIAKNQKISSLSSAILAVKNARREYEQKCNSLENSVGDEDGDEDDTTPAPTPKRSNSIGHQNATADAIINDILNRIDRKNAGEIRQIISRKENKLQALQHELSRRGLNPS